jgi:large subunit ribosomal protein L24
MIESANRRSLLQVLRAKNRVVVGGLNLAKRRVAPNQQFKGGIISTEAPMHVSNVNLVDPASIGSATGPLPTRVGVK